MQEKLTMTPREALLAVINHQEVRPVPYTFTFEDEVGAKIDTFYGSNQWRSAIIPYMAFGAAVDTDPKIPIDKVYAQDPFGGIWRMDRRPWHLEKPPLAKPSFDGYQFPTAETFYRPKWETDAITIYKNHPGSFAMGSMGWGLFERSWNLRGFENVLMDVALEPDFFCEMLDRLADLFIQFVDYTAKMPVDGILFGDDWGDQRGVIIGPDRWREFIKPRWARVYAAAHAHGKLVLHHSCGSIADIMPDIIEIGVDVLESVQPEAEGMNPYELKKKWGDKMTFWGCLGSQSIIPFGTPAEIKTEAQKLAKEMGKGGGYILAPAKPLQPETPAQNGAAMLEAFNKQE
jgi:uroporphyrinogen decarboxylase